MKTVQINLYKIGELSEQARAKAIENNRYIHTEYEKWWDNVYEDAENAKLTISGFNLDYGTITIDFYNYAMDTAESIQANHGQECETYKLSVNFIYEYEKLVKAAQDSGIEDLNDGEIDTLEELYLLDLGRCYLYSLRDELAYKESDECVIQSLMDADFTETGERFFL